MIGEYGRTELVWENGEIWTKTDPDSQKITRGDTMVYARQSTLEGNAATLSRALGESLYPNFAGDLWRVKYKKFFAFRRTFCLI
eukprot:UN25505